MGGAIALIAGSQRQLETDGLILLAPAVHGRRYLSFFLRIALWISARTIPWYNLTGQGLGIQASDNIPMLRKLAADPLTIKNTRVDTVKGLIDTMDAAIASPSSLKIPALILHGARDELVPQKPIFDTIRALPVGINHRYAVYRSGWHLLLRDLKAKVVLDDIIAWINSGIVPLPSGADRAARVALSTNQN